MMTNSLQNQSSTLGSTAEALRTIRVERIGLEALETALSGELGARFARAVETIRTSNGRVIVSGMGKSGHVGRKIAATLASTGTPAHFVHPAEASHGDLGMVQPEDVILALSWSGETAELAAIVGHARRFRVTLIGLTSREDSALGREADICLTLPRAEEACPNGLAPTTSTTMQMAMGDALAVALLAARGFTRQDFLVFHPGGKLGAQLRTVASIMHQNERLPLVGLTAPLSEIISVISDKGFGCAIVTGDNGKLAGVVTDGDLRRSMTAGTTLKTAGDLMTREPRTIQPEAMAAEALELVNRSKITALIVVDAARRPVGLVHVHDLLTLGVA
jgi:arabinose-5-phosphate isomerase